MRSPNESYTDMLARLFPTPGIKLGINSPHSKSITFQVTELSGVQDAPEDVF